MRLALLLLLGAAALASSAAAQTASHALTVEAVPVPLGFTDPTLDHAGLLAYRGGLLLSSADRDFGGWSGMVVSPDGNRVVLISDVGSWLTATLERRDGKVTGLGGATLAPLVGEDGRPLGSDKEMADAESLAEYPDGSLAIGFEHRHRVLHYPVSADGRPPLLNRPSRIDAPPGVAAADPNQGLEAMTVMPDGALLAFDEYLPDGLGHDIGWVFARPGGAPIRTLKLDLTDEFKPTDIKVLPNGDYLLLQRRFSAVAGAGARLSVVSAAAVAGDAPIADRELGQITNEMTVDNFECLGVWRDTQGKTRAIVVSDDNFSVLQRTLLLEFELPAE
ncbi:esterase-like activity of phytase family protein [Zavarzinia sp.]|uniref:esterase-like activity of phytase family protein n=1 Tax=Zavarzinia sp. TaxID=2027920 RepID=UPI0035698EB7